MNVGRDADQASNAHAKANHSEDVHPTENDYPLAEDRPGRSPSLPEWVKPEEGEQTAAEEACELELDEDRFQFSLFELLAVAAAASVLCSVVVTLSGDSAAVCAGLLGLCTLVMLIVLEVLHISWPALRLAWWVLLGIYLLACAVALLRGPAERASEPPGPHAARQAKAAEGCAFQAAPVAVDPTPDARTADRATFWGFQGAGACVRPRAAMHGSRAHMLRPGAAFVVSGLENSAREEALTCARMPSRPRCLPAR